MNDVFFSLVFLCRHIGISVFIGAHHLRHQLRHTKTIRTPDALWLIWCLTLAWAPFTLDTQSFPDSTHNTHHTLLSSEHHSSSLCFALAGAIQLHTQVLWIRFRHNDTTTLRPTHSSARVDLFESPRITVIKACAAGRQKPGGLPDPTVCLRAAQNTVAHRVLWTMQQQRRFRWIMFSEKGGISLCYFVFLFCVLIVCLFSVRHCTHKCVHIIYCKYTTTCLSRGVPGRAVSGYTHKHGHVMRDRKTADTKSVHGIFTRRDTCII